MESSPAPNSSPARVIAAAAVAAAIATCGWLAAGVGWLDSLADSSQTGHAMLIWGATIGAMFSLVVVALPHRQPKRIAIVVLGLWPFAAFGLFLGWQIALSAEQLANCHDGNADDCARLADRKMRRSHTDVAMGLYRQACELGHSEACATVAWRTDDPEEAATLFGDACDDGVARACVRLADLVDDPDRKLDLIGEACQMGDASACDRLRRERPTDDE